MPDPPLSFSPESPLVLATVSLTAAGLAAGAIPLLRPLALRTGFVDRRSPTGGGPAVVPLLGGLGLVGSVAVVLAGVVLLGGAGPAGAIVLGGLVVTALGLVDDRHELPAGLKLGAEIGVALALVAADVRVALPLPAWANVALTVFWIVGITNAFNLLDNVDGLSAGIGAITAAATGFLAFAHDQTVIAVAAVALAGACAGFLVHNFAPASIYLGDAGSLFLGFALAVLALELRFPDNRNTVTWLVPVLLLGPAILDTTLVTFSRLRRGLDPLRTPGRDHLSHRLMLLGCGPRSAVLILYGAAVLLAGAAIVVSDAGPAVAYPLAGAAALVGVGVLVRLDRADVRARLEHARDA